MIWCFQPLFQLQQCPEAPNQADIMQHKPSKFQHRFLLRSCDWGYSERWGTTFSLSGPFLRYPRLLYWTSTWDSRENISNGEMRPAELHGLKPSHIWSQEWAQTFWAPPWYLTISPMPVCPPGHSRPLWCSRNYSQGEGHGIKWTRAVHTEHRHLLDKFSQKSSQHAEAESIPLRSAELNTSRRMTAVNWIAKDKLDTLAKRKQSWQQQQMGRGGKENRNTARRCEP